MRKPQSLPRFALRYALWLVGLTTVWLVVYCGFINDQSGLRSTIFQLDLASGRTRMVEYYFWTRHEAAPQETWISTALARGGKSPSRPDWHTISSKGGHPSFITTYDCYAYGSVWSDVRRFPYRFAMHHTSPEAETEIAREIAKRWNSIPHIGKLLSPYVSALHEWISDLPEEVLLDAPLVAKFHEQAGVHMK